VTPAGFRRIALGLEGAIESAHHNHPDFRVGGRIFATLGYPDRSWGMVNLTPEQQQQQLREHPDMFHPRQRQVGRAGHTSVRLGWADEETLGEALTLAWQNTVAKQRTSGATGRRKTAPRNTTARKTGQVRKMRGPRS
jgi:hypothetical protein